MGLTARSLLALFLALHTPRSKLPRYTQVIVFSRAGVKAYQEVFDEFSEKCRLRTRLVKFSDGPGEIALAKQKIDRDSLVVTIGQEAYDALAKEHQLTLIPSFALLVPPGESATMMTTPLHNLFRALHAASPSTKQVLVVHGPRSQAFVAEAQNRAHSAALELVSRQVKSPAKAISMLHQLVNEATQAQRRSSIWLVADNDVMSPQLFQYALRLQLEHGIPLIAASRQQVKLGALLTVDIDPRAAGESAAATVNALFQSPKRGNKNKIAPPIAIAASIALNVNAATARRLQINTEALKKMGATVE